MAHGRNGPYRYYTCFSRNRYGRHGCQADRLPAGAFERSVLASMQTGGWAGFYPAASEEAIAQVESLRVRGARFLLIPGPAFWWLDHYVGLRDYLERGSTVVADETCRVYALEPS